jgi:hypothetical protein
MIDARVMDVLSLVYCDLWCRQRALVAILETRGVVEREHFESEALDYYRTHTAELVPEAKSWFVDLVSGHIGPQR